MKLLVEGSVRQPITVAVGVVLAILAGIVAFTSVPVQLSPSVESTVVTVTTRWENATPVEIESDVLQEQEEVLSDIDNLEMLTSSAETGQGSIRLEFQIGTDIEDALAQTDRKLSQVPFYPEAVSNPVITGVDPESIDYIAWVGLSASDPAYDASTLGDFMELTLRPRFERIPGISEVGIRGARESEVRIDVDEQALAARGMSWGELVAILRANNRKASGGALSAGKHDVRLLTTGRFSDPQQVEDLVLRRDERGTVYLRDIATVVPAFKEETGFVRIRGVRMPVFNFQLAQGANLLETMDRLQAEFQDLNAPGGLLEQEAQRLGVDGDLTLVQVYNAADYVNDAIDLVENNILIGGVLAVLTLLLFLRSFASLGIIALAIPISVIASVTVLTALGRSVNLISLAGFAFSIGMVVDNAIVVLENIYRHLEMGKDARTAAKEGAREVASAVFASTLTTLAVFLPVLFIEEAAGQLFRDIALAIMAAVGLSLLVSLTVIPAAASRILKRANTKRHQRDADGPHVVGGLAGAIGGFVAAIGRSWAARISLVLAFVVGTTLGIWALVPPLDYLPNGNRNMVFGIVFPPPGYSVEQFKDMGDRIQRHIRPAWETTPDKFPGEKIVRGGERPSDDQRVPVPTGPGRDADTILPPKVEHYFMGGFGSVIFHGAVAADPKKAVDLKHLMAHATRGEVVPDTFGFQRQPSIFRIGSSGSGLRVDLLGEDLESIANAGTQMFVELMGAFGGGVRPRPGNFMLRTPEVQIEPDDVRLQEAGLNRDELARALQAAGDGIRLVLAYEDNARLKDLRIRSLQATQGDALKLIEELPVATPGGGIVDLGSLATISHERVSANIRRVDRRRAVSVEITVPDEMPLQTAIDQVRGIEERLREQGRIPADVTVSLAGSAGNLDKITEALAGDGTFVGLISSSLFLALLVVYLVMVVLFQSWGMPVVIMVSVPLATFGGFFGLWLLHAYSLADPYVPVQKLDVLTILGFVILAGVVVNNAILIVAQTLNLLEHPSDGIERSITQAVGDATASRVRPILMSMTTSIGGMLPLVLMPGSGSEIYRGLAAVLVGGLALSTIFTLVLVPVLLEIVLGLRARMRGDHPDQRPGGGGKSLTTAGIAVAMVAFSGCAVGPDYRGAPQTAADTMSWELPAEGRFSTDTPSAGAWWQRFQDPTLSALIQAGEIGNNDLQAAVARLQAAHARLQAISGQDLPQISATAALERGSGSENIQFGTRTQTEHSVGFSLDWEIDLWGRVRRMHEAAFAESQVARADVDAIAVSIRASIASTYVAIREHQQRLAAARRNESVLADSLELARIRFDNGLAPQVDVARAIGALEEVRGDIPALQRLRDELLTTMAVLLGRAPGQLPQALQEPAEVPQPPSSIAVGIPADLLRRRGDVVAAERALAAQTARVGVATADLYPTISLTGLFGWATNSSGTLFDDASQRWFVRPGIGTLLFDRGRLYALVDQEEAGVAEAVATYEQTVLRALKELDDAMGAFVHEDQRRLHLQRAVDAQREAVQLAQDAYGAGISAYLPVLDAQRQLVRLEDRLIATDSARTRAIVATYRALGGSWTIPETLLAEHD